MNLKCVPITPFIDFWHMSLGEASLGTFSVQRMILYEGKRGIGISVNGTTQVNETCVLTMFSGWQVMFFYARILNSVQRLSVMRPKCMR